MPCLNPSIIVTNASFSTISTKQTLTSRLLSPESEELPEPLPEHPQSEKAIPTQAKTATTAANDFLKLDAKLFKISPFQNLSTLAKYSAPARINF